jgi:hypothetical protein
LKIGLGYFSHAFKDSLLLKGCKLFILVFMPWSRIFDVARVASRVNEVTLINRLATSTAKWEIFPHNLCPEDFWSIGEWVHIVVTVAGKEMRLFKNGIQSECQDMEDDAEPSTLKLTR